MQRAGHYHWTSGLLLGISPLFGISIPLRLNLGLVCFAERSVSSREKFLERLISY
jgi:hypothetical protein